MMGRRKALHHSKDFDQVEFSREEREKSSHLFMKNVVGVWLFAQ